MLPPIDVPRIATAIELNDAEQFKMAINNYAAASRKLIADIKAAHPSALPPEVAIPAPQTEDSAGGTLHY
ncbi:MAG: hypothetical protein ACKVHE_35445 [Planctomycetales bacterium]|jgi:hypothetical protein